ncbi:MAG: hypothetical protein V4607_13480 [Pseudomonadota bacterium]
MNIFRTVAMASLLGITLLAGCASPERRIEKDPASYSKLTPLQQEQVRKGDISIDMPDFGVELALGKPDNITERIDAKGSVSIWHYKKQDTTTTSVDYIGFYNPYFYPGFAPVIVNNTKPAGDRVRVSFSNQKVIAIERELKR